MSPAAYATSTLSFAGGEFEVQVVISDMTDQVVNVRLYDRTGLILSAGPEDLEGARCEPAKQTLNLVLPANGRLPRLVLVARGRKARMTYGSRTVNLKSDWTR